MVDTFSLLQKYTGINRYSQSEVITPQNIVKDMVDLLPQEVFNPDATFFDPAVKSGRFLIEIYNRLMASPLLAHIPEQDRHNHIIEKQLFGFATSPTAATVVRKALYNDPLVTGNIRFTSGKATEEIQGAFNNMKFDVIIGNPPYNNDVYIPFVLLGKKLMKPDGCMSFITPAKWQAKAGDLNDAFRTQIVPYMSKIVFYPNATDIFDIAEIDGISYYLVDNELHDTKIITNKSSSNYFNSIVERRVDGVLNNDALPIISKLTGGKISINTRNNHFKLGKSSGAGIKVYSGGKISGECTQKDIGSNNADIPKYKVVSNEMLGYAFFFDKDGKILGSPDYKVLDPGTVCSSHYCVYKSFNNKGEADSLVSYLNTKLIRFITALTLTGTTTSKPEFWRFVPDPGALDHIFTDQELYTKYGLSDDEIKLIESVIKSRK